MFPIADAAWSTWSRHLPRGGLLSPSSRAYLTWRRKEKPTSLGEGRQNSKCFSLVGEMWCEIRHLCLLGGVVRPGGVGDS